MLTTGRVNFLLLLLEYNTVLVNRGRKSFIQAGFQAVLTKGMGRFQLHIIMSLDYWYYKRAWLL